MFDYFRYHFGYNIYDSVRKKYFDLVYFHTSRNLKSSIDIDPVNLVKDYKIFHNISNINAGELKRMDAANEIVINCCHNVEEDGIYYEKFDNLIYYLKIYDGYVVREFINFLRSEMEFECKDVYNVTMLFKNENNYLHIRIDNGGKLSYSVTNFSI